MRLSGTACPAVPPAGATSDARMPLLLLPPCRAAGAPVEADPHARLPRLHNARLQDVSACTCCCCLTEGVLLGCVSVVFERLLDVRTGCLLLGKPASVPPCATAKCQVSCSCVQCVAGIASVEPRFLCPTAVPVFSDCRTMLVSLASNCLHPSSCTHLPAAPHAAFTRPRSCGRSGHGSWAK